MEMTHFIEFWDSLGYSRYILVLLIVCFCFHLIFLIYRAILLFANEEQEAVSPSEGVSVIITCGNKAELLQKNLEAFLEQDYPCFEIIVVDECSEDETQYVLAEWQEKYPNLKTSRIFPETKFRCTKKLAINLGVLAAQYDVLLFTEINCVPESKNWIRSMQSYFDKKTAVVIGYSNYAQGSSHLDIRRYFRFLWFWKAASLIDRGIYAIGNGYNMGYRKKYYLEKKGFTGNTQEYIGYDTEMVEGLSKEGTVKIVKDEDSRIIIEGSSSKVWKDDYSYYYATKSRWAFKAALWSNLDFVLEALFYVCSLCMLVLNPFCVYLFIPVVLVFLIDLIVINICFKKLKIKKIFITSLLINTMGFMYKWCYSIYSTFVSKKWK